MKKPKNVTPDQWAQYQALAGMQAHQDLTALIQSAQWKAEDRDQRDKDVGDTVRRARAVAEKLAVGDMVGRAPRTNANDPWFGFRDAPAAR